MSALRVLIVYTDHSACSEGVKHELCVFFHTSFLSHGLLTVALAHQSTSPGAVPTRSVPDNREAVFGLTFLCWSS